MNAIDENTVGYTSHALNAVCKYASGFVFLQFATWAHVYVGPNCHRAHVCICTKQEKGLGFRGLGFRVFRVSG